jgi:prevent-host-death family protein
LTIVIDHGIILTMETMAISKFKATCLAVLEKVRRTGKPILVTRFGEPIAEVVPPTRVENPKRQLGTLRGTLRVVGDIVSPATDEGEWDVLRS